MRKRVKYVITKNALFKPCAPCLRKLRSKEYINNGVGNVKHTRVRSTL